MSEFEYLRFSEVNPGDLMVAINEDSLRTHLIDHPYFDSTSIQAWMEEKIKTDAIQGCRIRVVFIDGELAGWCGVQPDNNGFELAIVISQKFWGYGIQIFKTLMCWAKELGHTEVLFRLPIVGLNTKHYTSCPLRCLEQSWQVEALRPTMSQ
jgi:hypothetical protein